MTVSATELDPTMQPVCRLDKPTDAELENEFVSSRVFVGCEQKQPQYREYSGTLVCAGSFAKEETWEDIWERRNQSLTSDELLAIADVIDRRVGHLNLDCAASEWLLKSAQLGNSRAIFRLGLMLSEPQKRSGLVRDITKARYYFAIAEDLGHNLASRALADTAGQTVEVVQRKNNELSEQISEALNSSEPTPAHQLADEFNKRESYAREALKQIRIFQRATDWGTAYEVHAVDLFFLTLAGTLGDNNALAKVGIEMLTTVEAPLSDSFSVAIVARAANLNDEQAKSFIQEHPKVDWNTANKLAQDEDIWKQFDLIVRRGADTIREEWAKTESKEMTKNLERLSELSLLVFANIEAVTSNKAGPTGLHVQEALHSVLVNAAQNQNSLYQMMVPGVTDAAQCDDAWCILRDTIKFRWHVVDTPRCRNEFDEFWDCKFRMRQVVRVESGWMGIFGWKSTSEPWQQQFLSSISEAAEFDAVIRLEQADGTWTSVAGIIEPHKGGNAIQW